MTTESLIFSLLHVTICDADNDKYKKAICSPEMLASVFGMAHKHDLAYLVAYSLEKYSLLPCEILPKFEKAKTQAIYRYLRLEHGYEQIRNALETAKVPFIPLKGTVLRAYFPEPWMRTSCDIDILVQEEMLEEAATALTKQLGYIREKKSNHDVSFAFPNGVHLELHYRAVDEGRFHKAQTVLDRIWQVAVPAKEGAYQRELPDEMFYFYHIVHMAKHIENGGCGIRPFLDLWILNHRVPHDRAKRNERLEEGNLVKFTSSAEKLSEVWFSDAQPDGMTQKLGKYVLYGGAYGVLENKISVNQSKVGGKVEYALQKIFLPYDRIKYHYPILQKYRILTPLFEVVSWFKLLFKGGVKRSMRELRINEAVSQKGEGEIRDLLTYLGLQ